VAQRSPPFFCETLHLFHSDGFAFILADVAMVISHAAAAIKPLADD
jgi:hypothetical protein